MTQSLRNQIKGALEHLVIRKYTSEEDVTLVLDEIEKVLHSQPVNYYVNNNREHHGFRPTFLTASEYKDHPLQVMFEPLYLYPVIDFDQWQPMDTAPHGIWILVLDEHGTASWQACYNKRAGYFVAAVGDMPLRRAKGWKPMPKVPVS